MSISSRAVALIVPKPLDRSPEYVARWRYNRFAKLDQWTPKGMKPINPLGSKIKAAVPPNPLHGPSARLEHWLSCHPRLCGTGLAALLGFLAYETLPPIIAAAIRLF